jgi:hypothetical protein
MDNKMIVDLETKYGVKIKEVYDPETSHGTVYGIYKEGYGLHTFLSYGTMNYNPKRALEYTIMCLQMKLNEIKRNKINEQSYKIEDVIA